MRHIEWRRRAVALAISAAFVLATGCDGEEEGRDTGTNGEDPADATGDAGDAGNVVVERCGAQVVGGGMADAGSSDADTTDASGVDTAGGMSDDGDAPTLPSDFSFADEYKMRFSDFTFDEDSPGSEANGLLQQRLDQSIDYPIIVLLHLDNVDPEAGTLDVRGGAGLKVDTSCDPEASECEYQWDPNSSETYNEIELDSETGELLGGLERLEFVGTNPGSDGEDKFTIPIRDIYFSEAYLSPDGEQVVVSDGQVEGYVTLEDARDATIRITEGSDGTQVSSLLGEDEMNYDADGDGEVDAWCLSATFSAKETTIVQN